MASLQINSINTYNYGTYECRIPNSRKIIVRFSLFIGSDQNFIAPLTDLKPIWPKPYNPTECTSCNLDKDTDYHIDIQAGGSTKGMIHYINHIL